MRSLFFLAATLAAILLATPVRGADLGSPVPMPTGDTSADLRSLASYLKERDARTAEREEATAKILLDLSRQVADLKTRVSAGEKFASKMGGYTPPPTATAAVPAPVVQLHSGEKTAVPQSNTTNELTPRVSTVHTPLPAPVVAVPPFGRSIGVPNVVTSPPPAAAPGSFAGGYQTGGTYINARAPSAISSGRTRGGPLGLGILPTLGGYCGGNVDPTPGYAIQYAPVTTYALPTASNCPPGGCPAPAAYAPRSYGYTAASH